MATYSAIPLFFQTDYSKRLSLLAKGMLAHDAIKTVAASDGLVDDQVSHARGQNLVSHLDHLTGKLMPYHQWHVLGQEFISERPLADMDV
jgi:hypothetical protein